MQCERAELRQEFQVSVSFDVTWRGGTYPRRSRGSRRHAGVDTTTPAESNVAVPQPFPADRELWRLCPEEGYGRARHYSLEMWPRRIADRLFDLLDLVGRGDS